MWDNAKCHMKQQTRNTTSANLMQKRLEAKNFTCKVNLVAKYVYESYASGHEIKHTRKLPGTL